MPAGDRLGRIRRAEGPRGRTSRPPAVQRSAPVPGLNRCRTSTPTADVHSAAVRVISKGFIDVAALRAAINGGAPSIGRCIVDAIGTLAALRRRVLAEQV